MTLALPSLAGVPRAYTLPADERPLAAAALPFARRGLVGGKVRTTREALERGLAAWLDAQAGPNARARFFATYVAGGPDGSRPPAVYLGPRTCARVYAGTRLEWLERRYAGTGRAVLGALARASGAGFRLMMPHHVFAMCQRLHWQDAEDERCIAEECAAEGEAYDGPTREQWRRHAPDWALSWSIAKARPGPRTPRGIGAAIAGVDAAIRGMRKGKPLLEITEGDYADQDAFTHWILWRGGALEERVVDDWFQEVWNTGEVLEHFAERHVEQPEALLAALDTLQPALALYRAVDALLDACRLPRG